MTSNFEYALMAGRAYYDTRADINRFPVPQGWTEIPLSHVTTESGFEGVTFQRGTGSNLEIVISFAGTAQGVDWLANSGLATGFGSEQLSDAAAYYLEIRTANPGATVSFTGHSLGGGLASLMGVFFNRMAVTFDQAPFYQSANLGMRNTLIEYLRTLNYTDAQLAQWVPELGSYTDLASRQTNVVSTNVAGEALSLKAVELFGLGLVDRIGNQVPLFHGATGASAIDLHSQTLLAAFLQNVDFQLVTYKLPDLIPMIFDSKLFYNDPNKLIDPVENLIERLVRHQAGNIGGVPTGGDKMLDRFTKDMEAIAQDGDLTMSNNDLTKALTAFAMQMVYEGPRATQVDAQLFTRVSGGIRFDRADIAATLETMKGYNLYLKTYIATLPVAEQQAIAENLSRLTDWFIQAGSSPLNATATNKAAFMLGGTGADALAGSTQADLLVGNTGNDILTGRGGDDSVIGGTGYDSYVWTTGDGDDTLIDTDRKGRILINGSAATLFVKKTDTTWVSPDNKLTLTQPQDSSSGWKLTIDGGGSLDLGTSFTDGDFGLHRLATPAATPTTVTIEGDKAPKEFTANFSGPINPASHGPGWHNPVITITAEHADPEDPNKTIVDSYKVTYNTKDALDNYVTDGAAPDRDDTLFGHASQADYIQSGGGADVIDAKGGHDRIQAGSGDDRVSAGAGDDLVEGGAGADILFGEADADILWGDTAASGSTPIAGAIANAISTTDTEASQAITGDWLDGGVGNDVLIGGAAKDVLLAGLENDLLIGGAGDDLLLGDGWTVTGPIPGWSPLRQVSTNSDTHVTSYTASFQGATALWPTTGGGADMLYGGAGDDWLFAGGGDDVLDGGTGQDVLLGEAGNDVVRGGAGNDVLGGDNASTPEALQGHDWLEGGEGNDTLTGLGGDDVLIGGGGEDILAGGAGRDTYIIAKGEGTDTIIDTDAGADKSNFVFGEGVRSEDITLRLGSLLLDLGGGDAVHIEGFDRTNPLANELGSFSFADGSTLSWNEMLARGFDLDGTEGDDTIFGTGIEDRIDGKAGNDLIWGGDGNDVLTGGTGTDGLNGGLGNDVYVFSAGDAATMDGTATGVAETLAEEGGQDTIRFTAGVDPQQLVLTDNLDGSLVIDFSAPEQTLDRLLVAAGLSGAIERFEVGAGDDPEGVQSQARNYSYTQFIGEFGDGIYRGTDADGHEHASGGRGSDDVGVSGGGNHVSGGKGNDTVRAFGLNNTIHYSAGDGTDTVWTNVSGNPGNVLRLSGIDASQLRLGLDASRYLVVTAGENADDRMVFQRFDASSVAGIKAFDHIEFDAPQETPLGGDGSTLSYDDLMASMPSVKSRRWQDGDMSIAVANESGWRVAA